MIDISIVILNYNGAAWLERCIESVRNQTIYDHLEIIVADNQSPDGSAALAGRLMAGLPRGRFIQHGENLGFCEGNNRAAKSATGEFLFFLNNDTWLEPDCLEQLLEAVRQGGAQGGSPVVLDYDSDAPQSWGAAGLDLFGLPSAQGPVTQPAPQFAWCGCSLLIRRDWFERLGGFDREFFLYGEETDLCWRVWLAGGSGLLVPAARLHHRGEANANPAGGITRVESRTSAAKRYYSNRNGLLAILKNARHVLLLLAVSQVFFLGIEALVWLIVSRNAGFIRRAYWDAFWDAVRLRPHVQFERRRLAALRRRSDWFLLRFLRLRPNRWTEFQRVRRFGLPRISRPDRPGPS